MSEITVTMDELSRLIALEAIQESYNKGYQMKEMKMWADLERLMGEKGTTSRKWKDRLYAVPDEILVKLARIEVSSNAYGGMTAEIGEGDVEGKVPGVDYEKYDAFGGDKAKPADLSPIGPASYIGKMILELARRLEQEIIEDKRMLGLRGILPPEAAEALEQGKTSWTRGKK